MKTSEHMKCMVEKLAADAGRLARQIVREVVPALRMLDRLKRFVR